MEEIKEEKKEEKKEIVLEVQDVIISHGIKIMEEEDNG
jgi:hypothetical protein